MRCVVLAGGELVVDGRMIDIAAAAGLVVAADSGVRHARALGVRPHALVGDFDSAAPEDLAAFPLVPRLVLPERKDLLDLEIAGELAIERGATELIVMGAFGGRADQSLASVLIGLGWRRRGFRVSLHDGRADCHLLLAGDDHALDAPAGTLFSLLALEDSVVTVSGAEYPLEREALPVGVGRGVSNRVAGEATAAVESGAAALFVLRGAAAV